MTISADPRVQDVTFQGERLSVTLTDGRMIAVPLSWFPRLEHATQAARAHWEIAAAGRGIHWPELDEDISVHGLLHGQAAAGAQHNIHP